MTSAPLRSAADRATDSREHVKGTLVQTVALGLRALRDQQQSVAAALAARLSEPAFRLLDEEIIAVRWYPFAPYCELVDLLWELAGRRDPAFIRAAGRAGAQALIDSGIYRAYVETSRRPGGDALERAIRATRTAIGLTQLLYDFVEVEMEHDAERHLVVLTYRNVASFSDALFHGTQGFLDTFSAAVGTLGDAAGGDENVWRGERPSRDRIVCSLSLDRLLS